MVGTGNIFEQSRQPEIGEELLETLASGGQFTLKRIASNQLQQPDDFWYSQTQAEWVVVLRGTATILFKDGTRTQLQNGDYINIPPHKEHRVEQTSDATVWLALYYKPTQLNLNETP